MICGIYRFCIGRFSILWLILRMIVGTTGEGCEAATFDLGFLIPVANHLSSFSIGTDGPFSSSAPESKIDN